MTQRLEPRGGLWEQRGGVADPTAPSEGGSMNNDSYKEGGVVTEGVAGGGRAIGSGRRFRGARVVPSVSA